MMLIRRWSRIILVTLLVLVITSGGAFTGCGKKTIVPPVFSSIDNQILQSASTKYLELKTSLSPDAALITLVNSLNSQNGVANANLGVDGTTIFINYTDGDMAAVDTYDGSATETSYVPTSISPLASYYSEAGIAATDVNQNQLELISFKNSSMSEIHKPDSSDFTTTLGKETTSARNQDISTQLSTTTTVTPITTTTSAGDKGLIINPASTTTSTPVITTTSNPATASNTTKTGIMSKKVLILSPISDLFAPMKCRDSFLEYGWNPADVTLKMTSYSSTAESTTTSAEDKNLIINPMTTTTTTATTTPYINPNALLINPEDFFNLSGYGVIIINAHGCYLDSFNENSIYLQAGTVTKEKFDSNNGNNDYRQWKDAKQLLIESCPGTASSDNAYQVLIRGDLLRAKMSQLSASYVEMATCWGSKFGSIFLDKGAKSFISWDNHANEYYADANQVRMIGHMLEGMSVNDAYQNSSIVKQYTISAGEINVTKSLIINPISGPNVVNYFNYSNIDPHSIYFPAWVNLKVPVLPVGTSRLKVDIYDAGKNLYVTEDKALAAGQTSMKIDNFGDNCFPPGPCSVVTSALDSKGSILLANEAQFKLHVGANDLTISSSEYQYSISGSEDPKTSINFSRSGGIWLYIKLNGQFLVSGTWSSGSLNFNAQSGDELEIMVVGNSGETFSPDVFSASLGPLWFTSWLTGEQVQLTDGMNFKQFFGYGDTVVFDKKFTIPGSKPSTPQTSTSTTTTATTLTSTTVTPTTGTPTTSTITTPTTTFTITTTQTSTPLTQVNVWLTTTNDSNATHVSTLKAGSVTTLYIWAQGGNGQTGDFNLSGTLQNGTQMQLGTTKHATPGNVIYCGQWNGGFLNTVGSVTVNATSGGTGVGSTSINITN